MVDGFDSWQHYLGDFLHGHMGQQQPFHNFDSAFTTERAKYQHAFEYFADVTHSSLVLYGTLQPEYKYADYLYVVKCLSNRRLLNRFRSGCHGLRVDTGRWADDVHLDRTGCVWCATRWVVWRTSSIFSLIVQPTTMLDQSM